MKLSLIASFISLTFAATIEFAVKPSANPAAKPAAKPAAECGTEDVSPEERQKIEETFQKKLKLKNVGAAKNLKNNFASPWNAKVNVWFHYSESAEVSLNQILSQMTILNSAFSNAGFKFDLLLFANEASPLVPSLIEAKSQASIDMQTELRIGDANDLNIYLTDKIVTSDQIALNGYSALPEWYKDKPKEDGIVLKSSVLPGGSSAPERSGYTLVHEVGHWLGLLHTHNEKDIGCSAHDGKGDYVKDTPTVEKAAYGCVPTDSCTGANDYDPGVDPINNYMSYSDDTCRNNFTPGQEERMQLLWSEYRSS